MNSPKDLLKNMISYIRGIVNIPLTVNIHGKSEEIVAQDTLYSPELKMNLLSIGIIGGKGN